MQSEGKSEGMVSRSDISIGGFTPARGNFALEKNQDIYSATSEESCEADKSVDHK